MAYNLLINSTPLQLSSSRPWRQQPCNPLALCNIIIFNRLYPFVYTKIQLWISTAYTMIKQMSGADLSALCHRSDPDALPGDQDGWNTLFTFARASSLPGSKPSSTAIRSLIYQSFCRWSIAHSFT